MGRKPALSAAPACRASLARPRRRAPARARRLRALGARTFCSRRRGRTIFPGARHFLSNRNAGGRVP